MDDRKKLKPYTWAILFTIILAAYTLVTMLITFVIPHDDISADSDDILVVTAAPTSTPSATSAAAEAASATATSTTSESTAEPEATAGYSENSYYAPGVQITLTTVREYSTQIYIADVIISDTSHIKAGLANNTFGRNIAQKTSKIASTCGAVLAINGDYYGFRDTGLVMRNSKIYRTTKRTGSDNDILVIYSDGSMKVMDESTADAVTLAVDGAIDIYSFGPGLISDGEILVTGSSEVAVHASSNPRTAIGMIEPLHYIFMVSDGRTSESDGLSLYEVAQVMSSFGCVEAYNLDGGGSSTMYFNGKVINVPTTDGKTITERSVSDIVYIS